MSQHPATDAVLDRVSVEIKRYWGFDSLRPIQAEAIRAGLDRRDSLVVMPTGGGKSLCYQVPPLVSGKISIVVSPLISLMKDQVDGLRAIGYPAEALHSGVSPDQKRKIANGMRDGEYKLLFVAPERLMTDGFLSYLDRIGVHSFAIDEAHCISQWGHDFRPEYRQLTILKQRFPDASIHAYTATATPRVREDIVQQLGLADPAILVGVFDRPNLTYRVLPLNDLQNQVLEVIRRHENEASIIYCISRADTEALAAFLKSHGIKAGHYHAGLPPEERRKTQEQFSEEELDVVTATVAFGMGIDRSNVRCVIHAAIPKTIEGYQQETGRAGRDGLEAECVLFYSPADVLRWEGLITKNAQDSPESQSAMTTQLELLKHMQVFCNVAKCRHRSLSEYFGQDYPEPNCGACDVCLNEVEGVDGATVIAQKILSAVARTGQRFGVGHVVDVLIGANTEMIRRCRHEQLPTYGLLRDLPRPNIQAFTYQLIDQGLISRTPGDRPTLFLNDHSVQVMRNQREVFLIRPKQVVSRAKTVEDSWEGVDRGLFEALRELRKRIAHERGVPPFVIFTDVTLREMARKRPSSLEAMRKVKGVGDKRLADLGDPFLEAITDYCLAKQVSMDVGNQSAAPLARPSKPNPAKQQAQALFLTGTSIQDVVQATGRARSTVCEYLVELIENGRIDSIAPWVPSPVFERVKAAAVNSPDGRLTPIFEALDGQIPFDEIKLTVVWMRVKDST